MSLTWRCLYWKNKVSAGRMGDAHVVTPFSLLLEARVVVRGPCPGSTDTDETLGERIAAGGFAAVNVSRASFKTGSASEDIHLRHNCVAAR